MNLDNEKIVNKIEEEKKEVENQVVTLFFLLF